MRIMEICIVRILSNAPPYIRKNQLSIVWKTIVEKITASLKKIAVEVNKSLICSQKPAIDQQKYNEPSKANILKVYDEIEKNQIYRSYSNRRNDHDFITRRKNHQSCQTEGR